MSHLNLARIFVRALALRQKPELRSSRAPAEFSELRSGSRSGWKIGVALRPALRPPGARAPGSAPTKVKIIYTLCSIKLFCVFTATNMLKKWHNFKDNCTYHRVKILWCDNSKLAIAVYQFRSHLMAYCRFLSALKTQCIFC